MDFVDGRYWSESFSLFSVGLVSAMVLGLLAAASFLARKHGNAARRAYTAVQKSVGLTEGNALVIGVVQTDDHAPAIRVEIHQLGAEMSSKSGYEHTWTEFDRKQTTRPFRLRTADGVTVHVEPGDDVLFIDELKVTKGVEPDHRVMQAELTHGEKTVIEGVLTRVTRMANDGEGDYRGQQQSWLLRPPTIGKMLISTEPLPRRHEKGATFWSRTANVLAAFFVIMHVLLIAKGFWPLMLRHECCVVQVDSVQHRTSHAHHRNTQHTSIVGTVVGSCEAGRQIRTPLGTSIEEIVDGSYPIGARVPFQVLRGHPSVYRLGSGVGLSELEWWVLVIASGVLFLLVYAAVRESLPWYRAKLVQRSPGKLQ